MTSVNDLRRRALVAILVMVGGIGTFVPSPAIASDFGRGVSFHGRIVRGSVEYWMKVNASESRGFDHSISISISKLRDPRGVTALRQTQTWVFSLQEGDFYDDEDGYHIDAGGKDEPFHVRVDLERRDDRCGRNQGLFVTQPPDGAFRFETGNEVFATVTELPDCGKAWSFISGEMPGPRPCPLEGKQLWGSIHVKERTASDVARMSLWDNRKRTVGEDQVDWFVAVSGTLPARRFRLNRELNGGFLKAGGAPWLDGAAWFRSDSPLRRGDWYNCTDGREARTDERRGSITGDLMVDVIGFESFRVSDMDASAERSWVRTRR